jgi:hypothetical protein
MHALGSVNGDLLSARDARRQHKVHQTFLIVQSRHCPLAVRIHAILVDLEPLEASHLGAQGIIDLCEVNHDRA